MTNCTGFCTRAPKPLRMTGNTRTPGRSFTRARTSAMMSQAERRCDQSLSTFTTIPVLKIATLPKARGARTSMREISPLSTSGIRRCSISVM